MNESLTQWVKNNREVEEWIGSVSTFAGKTYANVFHRFFVWLTVEGDFKEYTPQMLLDFQDEARGRDKSRIINRLNQWGRELAVTYRPITVRRYCNTVHAFFSYNGVSLPRRALNLPETYVKPADQLLSRDEVVQLIRAAKLRDQTIYVISFQGGLGYREFNEVNHSWNQIESQIDSERNHIIVRLSARKQRRGQDRGFFTIIGGDGLRLLKEYLKIRGRPKPGEPIFIRSHESNKNNNPSIAPRTYRKNFETLCRRIGLIQGKGKGLNSKYNYWAHQLRDVFRVEWQKSGADPLVAEFLMGHVVDSNQYLRFTQIPEYVIEQFEKAESRLNVYTNPDPDTVPIDEVKRLRHELEEAKQGQSSEIETLRAEVGKMQAILKQQNDKLIDTYYMISSLPAEQQEALIKKLKRVNEATHEELQAIEAEDNNKTP